MPGAAARVAVPAGLNGAGIFIGAVFFRTSIFTVEVYPWRVYPIHARARVDPHLGAGGDRNTGKTRVLVSAG